MSKVYGGRPRVLYNIIILYPSGYFTASNGIFKFNCLALVVSEISGVPNLHYWALCAPWTPPRGKIFVPEASTLPHVIMFLISTF